MTTESRQDDSKYVFESSLPIYFGIFMFVIPLLKMQSQTLSYKRLGGRLKQWINPPKGGHGGVH